MGIQGVNIHSDLLIAITIHQETCTTSVKGPAVKGALDTVAHHLHKMSELQTDSSLKWGWEYPFRQKYRKS